MYAAPFFLLRRPTQDPIVDPSLAIEAATPGRCWCCTRALAPLLHIPAAPFLLFRGPTGSPRRQASVAIEWQVATFLLMLATPQLLSLGPSMDPIRETGNTIVAHRCSRRGASDTLRLATVLLLLVGPPEAPISEPSIAIVRLSCKAS